MSPLDNHYRGKQSQKSTSNTFSATMIMVDVLEGTTIVGHGMIFYRLSDFNRMAYLYDDNGIVLKEGFYHLVGIHGPTLVVYAEGIH